MNTVYPAQSAVKTVDAQRAQTDHNETSCDANQIVRLAQSVKTVQTRVARRHRHIAAWSGAATLSLICGAARAADMTASFGAIDKILQGFVAFMTGPFGKAAVVISIVAAFVTWVFAPKEGIFGPVLRVVVAGVAILNAATFITNFTL